MRLLVLLAACSAAAPPPTPAPAPVARPIDAGIDAPPDAGLAADAAAWVFRYHTAQRTETWTLRSDGARAQLVVDGTTGTQRYWGTMVEGAVDVATAGAQLHLDCKPAKRALSARCNDRKAPEVDVLDCFHKDFPQPMPFGAAPGIEYVVDATCTGYRLIAAGK